MRLRLRRAIFTTSMGVTLLALGFVWVVLARASLANPAVAVGLAAGLATIVAFLWATSLAVPYAARAREIVETGRRYALGDISRPVPKYGDDDLGRAATALDAAVHAQERRIVDLSRTRARLYAIVGSMIEGVVVLDDSGHVQIVNDAARAWLGVGDDAIGRHYAQVFRTFEMSERLGRVLASGERQAFELRLTAGELRDVSARLAPVAGTGRGAVLVLHDVTDLRRLDQMRQDFVANVSHELRTPLTSIRGYAEALGDDSHESDAAFRARAVDAIQRHVVRMERLVTELLRLARLDAGQESLDLAPTDVSALLRDVEVDFALAIALKDLRVSLEAGPETVALLLDSAKVHDIARNLLENAVTHTPEGGSIDVVATIERGTLCLRVSDSGPGLPPDALERVFERFYRVDQSRSAPGTGLGLSIVRQLSGLHGGTARVRNRPEGGAEFVVELAVGATSRRA